MAINNYWLDFINDLEFGDEDMEGKLNYISYVRGYRQTILDSGAFPEVNFLCPNCGESKPFAGDNACNYYNNSRGCTLVCNDCLMEYEKKLKGLTENFM